MTPRVGAIAVVLHNDRVLLVQRRNPPDAGKWGFPGGHVESGETALHAAARELAEETGVIARPRHYLTNLDIILRDETGQVQVHYLLAGVVCDFVSGTPVAGDDASAAAWVPFADVAKLDCSADVQRVIDLARG